MKPIRFIDRSTDNVLSLSDITHWVDPEADLDESEPAFMLAEHLDEESVRTRRKRDWVAAVLREGKFFLCDPLEGDSLGELTPDQRALKARLDQMEGEQLMFLGQMLGMPCGDDPDTECNPDTGSRRRWVRQLVDILTANPSLLEDFENQE